MKAKKISPQVQDSAIQKFRLILLKWLKKNQRNFPWRKKETTSFEKVAVEILLQRTKAQTVANNYDNFFSSFKGWADLSEATVEEIGEKLKPLGLWRQRASKLKRLGEVMLAKDGKLPLSREEIDKLPGVGQYIANAIELFIHSTPKPLIDVNMARVLERYFGPRQLADIRYDPFLQELAHKVVDCPEAIDVNFAILDLGALICKAKTPLCDLCPLKEKCLYFRNNKYE